MGKRAPLKEPVDIVLHTNKPWKWRVVDAETGEVYSVRDDGSFQFAGLAWKATPEQTKRLVDERGYPRPPKNKPTDD